MLGTRGQSGGFQAEMNGDSSSVPKSSAGPHYFLVVKRRDTEELNLGSTVLSESSRPQSTRWACLRVHEMSAAGRSLDTQSGSVVERGVRRDC